MFWVWPCACEASAWVILNLISTQSMSHSLWVCFTHIRGPLLNDMLFRTFRLSLSRPASKHVYKFTLFAITPLPTLLYISIKFVHLFVTNRFVVEKKNNLSGLFIYFYHIKKWTHSISALPYTLFYQLSTKDIFLCWHGL